MKEQVLQIRIFEKTGFTNTLEREGGRACGAEAATATGTCCTKSFTFQTCHTWWGGCRLGCWGKDSRCGV